MPTQKGFVFVEVSTITYCEAEGNYTYVHLTEGSPILTTRKLKEFENMLQDFNFFRIHNSHLISLDYVKTYRKGEGGYVVMQGDAELKVSRLRKNQFLKRLEAL